MHQPLFFLHIPKTAGTTLNRIFDDNIAPEAILNVYTDQEKEQLKDMTYGQIAQHDLIRGHVFIANFADILDGPVPFRVMTFLRDPVDRVISEFHFLKAWPKSHLYHFLNNNDVSLAEYLTSDHPRLRVRGSNLMVNSLCGVGTKAMEDRLELAWHHLKDRFHFFGILERFDESIMLLKRMAGLDNIFYERQNVRAKRVFQPATPEEVALIQARNTADTELYERAVLEFDRRIAVMGNSLQAELRIFRKINDRFQRISNLIHKRDGIDSGALMNSK